MRDLALGFHHQARTIWRSGKWASLGPLAMFLFLLSLAALTAWFQESYHLEAGDVDILAVAGATWLAIVLLPAVGGGGDDTEGIHAVAAGKAFRAGIHLASTASDISTLTLAPALMILGALMFGWQGLAAGAAVALLGVLAGQAAGAGAARLANYAGPTVTLAGVAAASILIVRYGEIIGAGSWLRTLHDTPAWYALWLLALAGMLALTVFLTDRYPASFPRSRSRRMPVAPFLALARTAFSGVGRSLVARNSLLTAILIPLLAKAVGLETGATLAVVVVGSAAVMVGSNAYSYDGGGTTWLLGRVPYWQMLACRYLVALAWLALVATGCLLTVASVGGDLSNGVLAVAAVTAGAAAGLVPSTKRATSVNLDMPRAQPASPGSAIGVLVRTLLLVGGMWVDPLLGLLVVVLYTVLAFAHANRLGRDPVELAALS